MKYKFLIFCLAIFSVLRASDEEIRVYLNTTSPLEPIYIGQLQSPDNSLSADYLAKLQSVLEFDFNHNGTTKILTSNPEREKTLLQNNFAAAKLGRSPYLEGGN